MPGALVEGLCPGATMGVVGPTSQGPRIEDTHALAQL